ITAKVRANGNEQIRVVFRPVNGVEGPEGQTAASLRWAGSKVRGVAGAEGTNCTSGATDGNSEQQINSTWVRSGHLSCTVSFSLAGASKLPPGTYKTDLEVKVVTQ
ncbi:MAG: hypothetical protein HYZ37_16725, partial [Candidatus Solibacter usitatus]|nr:hypothetical protein [Candidatus Solibacter usitatus]